MSAASDRPSRSSSSQPARAKGRRAHQDKISSFRICSLMILAVLAFLVSACGGGGGTSVATSPSHLSPTGPSATGPEVSGSSSDLAPQTSGCRDATRNCLGVLEPGTYHSTFIDVFGTGKPRQLTYTVGHGWANTLDHLPSYWIRPKTAYLAADWDVTTSGIYVWANVAAAKQVSTCPEESDTRVGTSAASLADWLSGLPGLMFARRPSVVIDGHRAIVLDVRVSGTRALCGSDAPLLANRPGAPDTWVNGINISEAQRVMLFDLPGGHTAEVVVAGPRTQFNHLVATSRPVIASLHFTR